MMNNKDNYKRAFSSMHMPEFSQEGKTTKKKGFRLNAVAASIVVFLLAGGITIGAYSDKILARFSSWGGNADITIHDNDGVQGAEVLLHTENLTVPCKVNEGRLFFIVDNLDTDITDSVSVDTPYLYSKHEDGIGMTHYWAVGLNGNDVSNYGFAEYYKDDSGKVFGYSAMTNIESDGTGLAWLETAKKVIGVYSQE